MAGSLNRVILIGHLGKDPEIRVTQAGLKIASFSIATSQRWTDKASGEKKEKTEWHRIVIMNESLSGVAEKYLRKGSAVYLEGQMQTRKWTDEAGVERYITEVLLGRFNATLVLVDRIDDEREAPNRRDKPASRTRTSWDEPGDDYPDDEIPF